MEKSAKTKTRIIEAAIEIFGASGYDATAMSDIAARADVAKGTLYLYFASKDVLFEAAYQQCREERLRACAVDAEGQLLVMDKLCSRLRNGTRWELAEPAKNRLLRAYLTHPVFCRRVTHVVESLDTQVLMPIFCEGVTTGELRALPMELLVEMYIRFGSAVYYYIEKHPGDAENEEMWQGIYASLTGCLAAADHQG